MERLLTIDQVADLLQMTPGFVEQQIRLGYLEVVLIGTEWRIEPAAFDRYVEARKADSPLPGQQRLGLA